ncbi:response regulator transcription factor [Promicromonospora sp. Populi]|uniref:helix-turn-helix transcriptional regulator n=1 Tax=Promicromonospora sp. Populi TaxID=3239420 RepID=UPI0034E28F48
MTIGEAPGDLREPRTPAHWEPISRWALAVLAGAALIGAVLSVAAVPAEAGWTAAAAALQLLVTGAGLFLRGRPLIWAIMIGIVMLVTSGLGGGMVDLAASGAMPWGTVAVTLGAANLVRRAGDWWTMLAGSIALGAGSLGTIWVAVERGFPPAAMALAASVPYLAGVLIASRAQLREAREDRQRARVRDPGPEPLLAAARRALAVVVLRADDLVTGSGPAAQRRVAAEVREVARAGLAGTHGPGTVVRIEFVDPEQASPTVPAPSVPPTEQEPDLNDREREVLRMLATGSTNQAIARSIYLSEASVKQQVSRLMRRFDADNRTQLALRASQWFPPD